MKSSCLGGILGLVIAVCPGECAVTDQPDRARLVGSSFGIPGVNATYDYVIIGGGTSGLTVAKRLAENSAISVAVVEGGSFYEYDNGNYSQIPGYVGYYSGPRLEDIQPLVDWGIVTTSQTQLNSRELHYTQGKCLGGSSGRNYLAYHRGTKGFYQSWADEVGDQDYTFDNALPYFKKSITFTRPNYAKRGPGSNIGFDPLVFSPNGGPLQLSYSNFYQPISTFFKKAFNAIGLKEIPGFNSGKLFGFSEFTLTLNPRSGLRSSSETSFLQSALKSSSLQVYQQTVARKVNFDGRKKATGVTVATAGRMYTLSARKEVIVAAGAFRTPQLLMVSGIGPSATLKNLNIPVISPLEGVGQNLQDQAQFATSYRVNITTNSQLTTNPAFAAQATTDFLNSHTGPLSSTGNSYIGWEKLPNQLRTQLSKASLSALSSFPADYPELELLAVPYTTAKTSDKANYISILVGVLATTSRGNVTINSTDTNTNPLTSPNWLLTDVDQELAVQGLKRARQLASAANIAVGPEFVPGAATQSDAAILEYIKTTMTTFHHACATCAMGKPSNPRAVVDTKGRVFGVEGLRIVDASIFPSLPPGHIQATVYMIAEKLADDIKSGN